MNVPETLGGNVGLALTQAMGLTLSLQRGMRQWGELENQMISIERIQEYIDLEPEIDNYVKPPMCWPQIGRIEYRDVCLRYANETKEIASAQDFLITLLFQI